MSEDFIEATYNCVLLQDYLNNKKSGNDDLRLSPDGWSGWQRKTAQRNDQDTKGDHDGTYGKTHPQCTL